MLWPLRGLARPSQARGTGAQTIVRRTALVIGANRGIGLAIAAGLIDAGLEVIISARDPASPVGPGGSAARCERARVACSGLSGDGDERLDARPTVHREGCGVETRLIACGELCGQSGGVQAEDRPDDRCRRSE